MKAFHLGLINYGKKKERIFERNDIKIYNKLIVICDINQQIVFQYTFRLKNEHIINYIDLGKSISNNNNIIIINDINHENKNDYVKYTLPYSYNEKLKKN